MVFSSMIFLWVFLPMTLVIYKISPLKFKNIVLLISSLIFYSWGEPRFIFLMIVSILINYILGIIIEKEKLLYKRKLVLVICIAINISILVYFKYFNFIIESINGLLAREVLSFKAVTLPIGISFYTFQVMSYVIDVYRGCKDGSLKAERNILDLALYISFFPQLIAGPIVKYYEINTQIKRREETVERVSYGIKRFIYGLSKKVLISNVLAAVADKIFSIPIGELGTSIAWLGMITYSLQIYYDFSGYSDMAIGLGEIFGFTFMENFNYPYISKSIKEFWRRWHISLSTWFKEYLYIPLGGNRKGKYRTYLNLFIVFFMTGLWHGASFNFIIWGMIHGFFIIIENIYLGKVLAKPKLKYISHLYTILVVGFAWIFFRVETVRSALQYIRVLVIPKATYEVYNLSLFLNREIIIIIIIAIIFSGVIQGFCPKIRTGIYNRDAITIVEVLILTVLLFLSIISIVSGTYNPFIYFRF